MKFYIKAYREDNSQILGNLDGQGVIHSPCWWLTKQYKALSSFPTLNCKVAYYRIVTPAGRLLRTVPNLTHKPKES